MTKDLIAKTISKVVGIKANEISVKKPEVEDFGDYSTNIALVLSKKQKTKPIELAQEIKQKLLKGKDLENVIKKIEVKEPGFINFFISKDYLIDEVEKALSLKEEYGSSDNGKGKTVVIDYSSPNIAKQFSVGHLRSTVIGQSLYNIYKFLGFRVIGDNHLGDWGTQFGMIIAQIIRKKLDPKKLTISDFEKIYVEFNKEAEDNPKLKKLGQEWFKKLESGNKKAKEIWQIAVKNSLKEFDRIYDLLGVKIDHAYGESFYEHKMSSVIDLIRKNKLSIKSKGAEIVSFKDLAPAMLLKSDNATTYYTRDLATIKFRLDEWNPDLFIYEVGVEQSLHFKQVFKTAELLGWGKQDKFKHLGHGLFLVDGKKMSTRKGTTVNLEEVLKESIKKAKQIIEKTKSTKDLSQKEKQEISKKVGIGAIKYFDLMHSPESNINFDWEQIFNLKGNSAPYIQYTVARINSVIEKKKKNTKKQEKLSINKEEKAVLRTIIHFKEVVKESAEEFAPNLICNYLFDLASKYNTFYSKHRILGEENEKIRLNISKASQIILKNGLNLLGIQTPERM